MNYIRSVTSLNMAIQIKELPDDEVTRIIRKEIQNEFCDGFILAGEDTCCMPKFYANFAETIKTFEVQNSDVMVCSYPKSGTTWAQEMVWLIMNDCDFEGAKVSLNRRFPFLEYCTLMDFEKLDDFLGKKTPEFISNSLNFCEEQKSPRFIKTHLPFSLLPQEIQNGTKSPKMIYMIRNPKDVCVSYYHHGKILRNWKANFENFSKVFLADKVLHGSYWKNVLGYWERRNSPNLLILTYEDMKSDLQSVIKKTATFLNKQVTEEQMILLLEHLSFESMKKNNAVNKQDYLNLRKEKKLLLEEGAFIRSGTTGKYKEEMPTEIIAEFDAWIKQNIDGTSFAQRFNYIL